MRATALACAAGALAGGAVLAEPRDPDPADLAELEAGWRAGRPAVAATPGGCLLGLQMEGRGRRVIAVRPPAAHADAVP